MNEVRALKFSWEELSEKLATEIEAILGRKVRCAAKPDDEFYWCIGFPDARMPLSDVYKILESLNASERDRIDSIPPESEHAVDVSSIGMSASELLLRRHLGYQWEAIHTEDYAIWVIGEKDGDLNEAED